jgi:hypothetical protein
MQQLINRKIIQQKNEIFFAFLVFRKVRVIRLSAITAKKGLRW